MRVCVVRLTINTNSCSWKANWEHAQNLFNNLENKLLCVTTGKIVGEITSG